MTEFIDKFNKDVKQRANEKLAMLSDGMEKDAVILWKDGIPEKEFANYLPEQKALLAKSLRKGEVLPIVKGYCKPGGQLGEGFESRVYGVIASPKDGFSPKFSKELPYNATYKVSVSPNDAGLKNIYEVKKQVWENPKNKDILVLTNFDELTGPGASLSKFLKNININASIPLNREELIKLINNYNKTVRKINIDNIGIPSITINEMTKSMLAQIEPIVLKDIYEQLYNLKDVDLKLYNNGKVRNFNIGIDPDINELRVSDALPFLY
ncbi:MAG: hypothetical protein J6Y02_18055 [Pseudobutyrivibrio sp.]|nr:hypothetical protein [Pseudobutyrivibrio sp.]